MTPFISLTERDEREMLDAIGVSSIDELFRDVPEGVRFGRELDLEPALSEPEVVAHLDELARKNVPTGDEVSFLGAGIYDHYVPAVVDAVLQRGELLTAYTPYQPEMSQGVLQAIFEYQTAICELTGMLTKDAMLASSSTTRMEWPCARVTSAYPVKRAGWSAEGACQQLPLPRVNRLRKRGHASGSSPPRW